MCGAGGRRLVLALAVGCLFGLLALDDAVHLLAHRLDVREGPIDAGEADIGDGVKLAQPLHHHLADDTRFDLCLTEFIELVLDVFDDSFQFADGNRASLAGEAQSVIDLLAVEGFAAAIALDNHQLRQDDALDRAEALEAALTAAAAVDGAALIA